jgi:hypothetical protein
LIATPAEQPPIELGHSRNSDFGLLSVFGFQGGRTGSSLNWPDFRAALPVGWILIQENEDPDPAAKRICDLAKFKDLQICLPLRWNRDSMSQMI